MNMKRVDGILIGDIAKKTKTTIRTIRYYEELGLLSPKNRTQGGFRQYTCDDIDRVLWIRKLKEIDLNLANIKELFSIRKKCRTGGEAAAMIDEFLSKKVNEMDRRFEEYYKIKQELLASKELLKECVDCKNEPNSLLCNDCKIIKEGKEVPAIIKVLL
jgi:MerR family Zn(II)-responsive transcriptional regulator of zntA